MPLYHNNILCVTYAELTEGIVSKANYKNLIQRGKIKQVRRGCKGTEALIMFDSMATDLKTAVLTKYGNPREQLAQKIFMDHVVVDIKAHDYYFNYKLADGRHLPKDVQDTYCNNAKVLNAIINIANDRKALVKALGGEKKHIWPTIVDILRDLQNELKYDLPENPRSLKNKVNEYKKTGYESLISGKFLNKNSVKTKDIQQEALLRQLLSKYLTFDNVQIQEMYNMVANISGWKKITPQTVGNYREKWDILTIGGRKGEVAFDNTKAMLIKRKAPVLPLVYWTADGWDAELLYQKTVTNENGYSNTTYHNRLTIVVVLDPCEKYPVGYAIGKQESPELIREAFRNAINHTSEIFGKRHKVLQLQTDNYAKKNLTPFYEALSDKYTPARVKNAKSKIIEPYFNYLNKKYCQYMPNWSGFGVKSKNQPNDEYLNKIRHDRPDEMGCRQQLDKIMAMERAKKLASYRAAYAHLPEEDKMYVSDREYFMQLCETKDKTNRLGHSGMIITMNKVEREYDTFDADFRRYAHIDWTIKYDPSNLERILAVNEDGSLQFILQEKYVQPMALYDRKEGDSLKLQEVKNYNKSLKANIMIGMQNDHKQIEELFQRPELSDTLAKLMLVDSRGQHKDNKSAARLNGQKLLAKQEAKEEKTAAKEWKELNDAYLNNKTDYDKYIDD